MDCSMIRIDGVTKRFGDATAVNDASLCVDRGEVVALLGPSGCGKTTLLRLIAGFERPDRGSIAVDRRIVAGSAWVAPEARRVGMVFQDYALFPHLTVAANVGFGLPRRERAKRVPELLGLARLGGLEESLPARALGRPAAARRARSCAGPCARARAAGRAVVERRPVPARLASRGGDRHRAAARRHGAARHARPRGGLLARRPDRADARRHDRPGGHGGAALLRACIALGRRVRRRRQRASRPRRRRPRRDGARRVSGERRELRTTPPRCSIRPELLELEPSPSGARRRSSRASSAATTSSIESFSTVWSSSRTVRRRRSSTSAPASPFVFIDGRCPSSIERRTCAAAVCKVCLTPRLR